MAIGGMVVDGQGNDNHFNGKKTFAVVITSIVAQSGGLIFGFDTGILEMAHSKWRGAFSTGFQFFRRLGVITANCIYYGTSKLSWRWRLSLGLAIVPATAMTIGSLLISDTPSSLVGRGKLEQATQSLSKFGGTNNNIEVEDELAYLITQLYWVVSFLD